jgi:post-segregation antitoxin (ccd killing protein)
VWVAWFFIVSKVISVSIPEALYERWREADIDISPSSIFQSALETELDQSNRFLVYWSSRALNAEKKLSVIAKLLKANDQEIKKLLLFENDR